MKTKLTQQKKLFIMVIAILSIFSTVLVGCGKQNSDNVADETAKIEESTETTDESVETTEPTEETGETEETEEPTVESEPTEETEESTDEPESEEPKHTHSWSKATCTEPKKCECGETSGKALGHNFSNGKCSRCGTTDPNYQPPHTHNWSNATCTSPKTCTSCGQTSGSALGHNYSNGHCTRCGAHDASYVPPHTHSWNIIEWIEHVFSHQEVTAVMCCNSCGAQFTTSSELDAHQAETGWDGNYAHSGWHSDYIYRDIYMDVVHHRRECACGAVEQID